MKLRNRLGMAITTVAIGVIGTLGLTACGPTADAITSMSPEASALTELGFADTDVTADSDASLPITDPSATPTASKTDRQKHPRLRRLAVRRLAMRPHVEHGEVTVTTKDGDKTIDIQRGTVTAITDTSMTVKSTDGFTLTWTLGTPIRVIEHRTTVQPTDVAVGAVVGVAGTKDGDVTTARLVVIPAPKTK